MKNRRVITRSKVGKAGWRSNAPESPATIGTETFNITNPSHGKVINNLGSFSSHHQAAAPDHCRATPVNGDLQLIVPWFDPLQRDRPTDLAGRRREGQLLA
jgi:hypothetical protein